MEKLARSVDKEETIGVKLIVSAHVLERISQVASTRKTSDIPCPGYMAYPFQKGVMLMALTISFSLLLTQQIGGEKISHLIKTEMLRI